MSYAVVGEVLKTADMATSPPTFFHRFDVNRMMELKAVRLQVVKYGVPSLSSLGLELRSGYQAGSGGRGLIATASTTYTLAGISTANYSCAEIFFEFDQAPLLAPNVEYTLNLTASGYTGDDDNHLAWVRTYPDPIVSFSGSTTFEQLGRFPFHVALITREVRR